MVRLVRGRRRVRPALVLAALAGLGATAQPGAAMLPGPTHAGPMGPGPMGPSPSGADETQDDPDVEAIDRELRVARTGRPQIRPQAARRLVGMGTAAADRIVALCESEDGGLAALGSDVVEVLGQFQDERLRSRLWTAIGDPDFPWRPAASRALGSTAIDGEAARFVALLDDPLAAVRVGSLQGYRSLDLRDRQDSVKGALEDADDRVRRAAAALLDEWGERWALAWLLEDLRRVDEYFGRPHGRSARYASLKILEERLGDSDFDPRRAPDDPDNQAAWAELRQRIVARAGQALPELPRVARAGPAIEGEVLGMEVRSCRRGEFVLRWCEGDRLYVGEGNPARVDLEAGSVERLRQQAGALLEQLGRARVHGQPGCDSEVYHFRLGEARPVAVSLSKGPEAVEGLRPDAVRDLAQALLATLPEGGEDDRLNDLRAAVSAAAEAVGGPLGS